MNVYECFNFHSIWFRANYSTFVKGVLEHKTLGIPTYKTSCHLITNAWKCGKNVLYIDANK